MKTAPWLLQSKVISAYHHGVVWLNTHSLPGLKGNPVLKVVRRLFGNIGDSHYTLQASAMAFSFFFSIFPLLIFLFMLLPHVEGVNLTGRVLAILNNVLPPPAYSLIKKTVISTFRRQSSAVVSIAGLAVVFSASRGVSTLLSAINRKDQRFFRPMGFVEFQLRTFLLFSILGVLVLLTVGVVLGGEVMVNDLLSYLRLPKLLHENMVTGLGLLISLTVTFSLISFIYTYGPTTHQRWSFFSPGAFFTAVLLLVALFALRVYFGSFGKYNTIYGSLSAVMILMAWFYYISLVLLLGFELNVSIEELYAEGQLTVEQPKGQNLATDLG